MSLRYLPVPAKNALPALELARKEATSLEYAHRTLFAVPIDAVWVEQLAAQPELAEKVEAFVSRFGRLQDHFGEKLIPRFAALLGESPKSLLDVLAYAEKNAVACKRRQLWWCPKTAKPVNTQIYVRSRVVFAGASGS